MPERFDPQRISDDLKLLDHIMSNIGGASMIVDSMKLSSNLEERLLNWAKKPWTCDVLSEMAAKTAGMDIGVMNLYNTCISQVKSIFENEYFTRVWTFQEMIRKYLTLTYPFKQCNGTSNNDPHTKRYACSKTSTGFPCADLNYHSGKESPNRGIHRW